ncbi:MAG TPA: N-acetylmuramoyl-L-alanine amidase [Candidatus Binatia bacterium]
MRRLASIAILGVLLVVAGVAGVAGAQQAGGAQAPSAPRATVERIAWETVDGRGRLVIGVRGTVDYSTHVAGADPAAGLPPRAYVDLRPAVIGKDIVRAQPVEDVLAQRIRVGQFDAQTVRVVVDLTSPALFEVSTSERPPRLLLSLRRRDARQHVAVKQRLEDTERVAAAPPPPAAEAKPPVGKDAKPGATDEKPSDATVAKPEEGREAKPPATEVASASPAPSPAATPAPAVAQATPATRREPAPSPVVLAAAPTDAETPRAKERAAKPAPAPARPESEAAAEKGSESDEKRATEVAAVARTDAARRAPRRKGDAARAPRPLPTPTVWTVVIDPGHGGKDPGARGVTGEVEKNITLAVSKLVAESLSRDPNIRVVLTRTDDTYVSLEERTAIANANGADLFVSVHANASENPQLAGIETYTLNNTDDRATIRLAALENGLAFTGATPSEPDLAYILSDLVQTGKEDESVAAARAVQNSLVSYLRQRWKGVQNLGVKKGPFYVLVGAYMPCILVETAFLTNETEGQRIAARRYQIDVAEGIAEGIRRFFASETANANL